MTRWLGVVVLAAVLTFPAVVRAQHSTLDKIKATNTMTLGYREASVPFSFRGDDAKPMGYSVDLCTRVAQGIQQQLGVTDLKITWVAVTPADRIDLVVNGSIDLECGSTTNTLARQERVDFSYMTFVDGGSLLVSETSNITRLSDVAGKRIAVIPGTTTEKVMTEALQKANIAVQIVTVKEHSHGLAAVENGTADAYASDKVILIGLALTSKEPTKLMLANQYFSYEPYGLMMRRGDADFRLAVNRILVRLYRTRDIVAIYERWFGPFERTSNLLQAMYLLHSLPD